MKPANAFAQAYATDAPHDCEPPVIFVVVPATFPLSNSPFVLLEVSRNNAKQAAIVETIQCKRV